MKELNKINYTQTGTNTSEIYVFLKGGQVLWKLILRLTIPAVFAGNFQVTLSVLTSEDLQTF